ncbi:phospholipase D-like domain-containing protein [soil metagenome]
MQRFAYLHIVLLVTATLVGCEAKAVHYQIEHEYGVKDPQFARTMGHLLGPPLVEGNRVTTYVNGDQIFPAMLSAIAEAHETINFETYVYWSGDVGQKFSDALAERARAGLQVHVIIDWVGSGRIDHRYIKEMNDAGVHVVQYHPLRFYDVSSASRLNNRTHRKLLIVDGRIGFTGGAGIADEWEGNADSPEHWRDTHYRIDGPAVEQMQAAFMDNWMKTTGQVLHGEAYFAPNPTAGDQAAQVFMSSASGGSMSMQLMYLLSIAAAEKTVLLGSAYFVPDDLTIKTILAARKRGVRVVVLLPGKQIDVKTVRHASRARWGEMLEAGVEIYEYLPTMYHCKLMVVDDRWVSIGSPNLDNRSFRLNDEANLNVLSLQFAAEQSRMFEADLAKSRRITLEMWRNRPLGERFMEAFASLLGPLL